MGEHNSGNPELLRDLLARCRAGDRPAADRLIRRFYAYATSLARSLTNSPDHGDDAVQSAFVTVLTHLPTLRDPDAFPGWLRQIVRTECNRITRRTDPIPLTDGHLTDTSAPVDAIAHQELLDRVRTAVASLPAAQRETAELFYLDELPQADISLALDIPEGTVKRRLHDARNTLRSTLKSQLPI